MDNGEKFEYFMERTDRDFVQVHTELTKIYLELQKLSNFKFLSLGIVAGVSTLVSVGTTLFALYLKSR